MRKLLSIGSKDILVTLRDRPAVGILLIMPMILIMILGTALGGEGTNLGQVKVAIVNQDNGTIGENIADAFVENKKLKGLFKTRISRNSDKAKNEVKKGELAAVLIVPEDFSERVEAAKKVKLRVYTDPGQNIPAGIFRSVVSSVATSISATSIAAQTTVKVLTDSKMVISQEQVTYYMNKAISEFRKQDALSAVGTKEAESKTKRAMTALDYYSAGMGVMFLIFGAMFGAFSFINERADWTLPRLLVSPTSKVSIVGGKMLSIFTIGCAQFFILFSFTRLLGAYWGKSLAGVVLLALGTVFSTTGLAIFFSAIAKTRRAVGAIAPIVVNIMAIVGGSMLPVEIFPQWLKPLHFFTINGWAIDGFLDVMGGATAQSILPNVGALTGMGFLFFLVGVWRLRYE